MVTDTAPRAPAYNPQGEWGLWFGLAAGPVAWGLDLLISYALGSLFACDMGWKWVIYVVGALAAVLAAAGAVVAWREWSRRGESIPTGLHGIGSRQAFMAAFGVLISLLTLAGIILIAASNAVVPACA